MRPKKRILIWGATEMAESILRVVLDVHGYVALLVKTNVELTERIAAEIGVAYDSPNALRAVLLLHSDIQARAAAELECRRAHPWIGVVSLRSRAVTDGGMVELMQRLQVAAARRRGPQPQCKKAHLAARNAAARAAARREAA